MLPSNVDTTSALLLATTLILFGHQCACQTHDDVERLLSYLTNSTRYTPDIRPVRNMTTCTVVNISWHLYSMDSFDLSTGNVELTSSIEITWFDEYLTWNPSDYGGQTKATLPYGSFWKPKIFNAESYSSITADAGLVSSAIFSSGFVFFATGGTYKTTCKTDAYNIPLDRHLCGFHIFAGEYETYEIVFHHAELTQSNLNEHQEWNLEHTSANISQLTKPHYSLSQVHFTFTLSRRPAYMIMHMLIPYYLTVSLTLVTSFIPVDSGERVTFSLTLFLSFVFVVSEISNDIPADSKDVSLFSIFTTIIHVLNTSSVAWSVVITNIANLSPEIKIPNSVKSLMTIVSRNKKKQHVNEGNHHPYDQNDKGISENRSITNCAKTDNDLKSGSEMTTVHCTNENQPEHSEHSDGTLITWNDVAETFDKVYFYINLLIYVFSFAMYLGQILLY